MPLKMPKGEYESCHVTLEKKCWRVFVSQCNNRWSWGS